MLTNTLYVIITVCFLSDFSCGQRAEVFFRNDYTDIKAVNSSYKIHTTQKTWFEAMRECAQEGASLFYPENEEEHNAVMSFRKSTQPDIEWVFLGISDLMSEGVFETIDGKSVSEVYNNWNSDEPNDANGGEDCVELNKASKMNDCKCSKKLSFICKKSCSLSLERNNSFLKDGKVEERFFWNDYTYIEAVKKFYKIQPTPQTWLDAKRECAQEGAGLYYPESDDEQNAVMSFRKSTQPDIEWVFLGISDLTTEGEFETIDGKSVSEVYNNWNSDEPNDANGGEDCVEQNKAGKMNDYKCSEKLSFICKKSRPLSQETNNSYNIDGKAEERIFWNDYTYIEAVQNFYKIQPTPQTWLDAKRECAQEGAGLYYPESDDEQNAVMSFRKSTQPDIECVFLGISDLTSEGEFETIDGKLVSEVYKDWNSDEPNDANGGEDCVEQNKAGKMNDYKCSEKLSFICKKSRPLSLERNNSFLKDGQRGEEILRNDYTYIKAANNSYKIHRKPKTWFEANRECAQEGASLFYPENDNEQNAVMSFQKSTQPDIEWVFVGISDLMSEGEFETIDGKTVSEVYNNWNSDEPNDANGGEDCVQMNKASKMNDCKCSGKLSFICKKSQTLSLERNISYNADELTNKEFFRNDYTYIEAVNSFYKIHTTQQTWFDAKRVCAQEGASLFYPENDNEQNALMSFRHRTQPNIKFVFVGISDLISEGVFETIDGKSVSEVYNNWNSDEPNDANGGEDCVEQDNTGKMNDCNCSVKFSFICKKSLSLKRNNSCNIDYSFNKDIGKCYKLHNTPLKWIGAHVACRAEQSHLAVINNRLEADYLAKLTESASKQGIGGNNQLFRGIYHLGFHYIFKEGWQTVRGTPFTVDDDVWWDNQQPIIDEREQCGSMFYNGRLNTIDCDTKSFFICEHEEDSLTLSEEMFQ